MSNLLTVPEVARILRVEDTTVRSWVKQCAPFFQPVLPAFENEGIGNDIPFLNKHLIIQLTERLMLSHLDKDTYDAVCGYNERAWWNFSLMAMRSRKASPMMTHCKVSKHCPFQHFCFMEKKILWFPFPFTWDE